MNIRVDNLDRVALDRFVSSSGKYETVLACRMERGVSAYYIAVLSAGRLRKLVSMGMAGDEYAAARIRRDWERFKESMTAAGEEPEPTLLEEAEANALCLEEFYFNNELIGYIPVDKNGEERVKTKPIGARIFVKPIVPVDEVSARLKAVGMTPVIAEVNKPRPTMGVILEVGNDPMMQEAFAVGDVVVFSKHAGDVILENGIEYRSLGHHEIIGRRSAADVEGAEAADKQA